jgi:hypothetical protein
MIGVLGLNSWRGLGIFLFTTASRTALGSTQPPIQWVPRAVSISLVVKRPGREADLSPPSSAKVKEWVDIYLNFPNMLIWCGAQLKKKSTGTSWALSLGVKRAGREADHSPPSSTEVKNGWSYTPTPQYVLMEWPLIKHKDNFMFRPSFHIIWQISSIIRCVCSRGIMQNKLWKRDVL